MPRDLDYTATRMSKLSIVNHVLLYGQYVLVAARPGTFSGNSGAIAAEDRFTFVGGAVLKYFTDYKQSHPSKKEQSRPRNHPGNHPGWLPGGFSQQPPLAGGS